MKEPLTGILDQGITNDIIKYLYYYLIKPLVPTDRHEVRDDVAKLAAA